MKNKILIAVGVILVVLTLVFGLKINKAKAPIGAEEVSVATTTVITASSGTPPEAVATTKSEIKTTLSHTTWTVFQNYLTFAKAHNLDGIKSLSHQLSPTCADATKTKDCNTLMDSAYSFGKDMKEKDFVVIWSDSKQIILSTDFKRQEIGTTTATYTRGVIYFTRDSKDNIKVLTFNPEDGIAINRDKIAPDQLEARLINMTIDSDQDGLPDTVETCAGFAVEANCPNKITNPNKRDTNGDGWWDGVEIFFRK